MQTIARKIIQHRNRILAAALCLCAVCGLLALRVPINADMTKYLPDSSPMKQGIDLMAEEFTSLQMPHTIRVMLRLPAAELSGEGDGMSGQTGEEGRAEQEGASEPEGQSELEGRSVREGKSEQEGASEPEGQPDVNGQADADREKTAAADEQAAALLGRLDGIENVSSAAETARRTLNGQDYVLFTVGTAYDYQTREELKIESDILSLRKEGYDLVMVNDNTTGMQVPLLAYTLAVILLMAVLFTMCASWVEPFLFLAAIGIAIVLNLGTNIFLGSVSQTTWSMSAVLQLVLSMDYSVILMNRYRQEKAVSDTAGGMGKNAAGTIGGARSEAMVRAWQSAFPSVASSGFTTFVGLIMLVFMRFKIGKDLGLVLAKGVLLSLICVLTVLPGLILLFDRWVDRTAKKVLFIPTGALSRFSYRFRYVLTAGFVLLFALAFYMQSRSTTAYSLSAEDPIADVFPTANPVVLLYANEDEEAAEKLAAGLEKEGGVDQVISYGYTLGRRMPPGEMAACIRGLMGGSFSAYMDTGMDPQQLQEMKDMVTEENLAAVYTLHALQSAGLAVNAENKENKEDTAGAGDADGADSEGAEAGRASGMSVEELFAFVSENLYNPLVAAFMSDGMKEQAENMSGMLSSAREMLVGGTHSMMMISTSLPVESEETEAFIRNLKGRLGQEMKGSWYLIGNSPMSVEMKDSFRGELTLITLLTAAAIFVVVAVTFRQLLIPLLLVCLVQCGVFMTISTVWLLGYSMYFLAIIIVQCILMGATVDYAILMTSYYREIRISCRKQDALRFTYERSIHTVLTSAMFMIFVTGALGFSPVEPTIGQICQSIALGALSATLLVVFVLPGMLSALDRGVIGRGRARD